MRSFTIGRITGIPIRLNLSLLLFLPLLVWLIATQVETYANLVNAVSPIAVDVDVLIEGNRPWLIGLAGAVGLFVGVLLHELGHAWTAMRYEIPIASITLWIFGGLARMENLPEDWDVEFWVALAGPAASVLIAAACYAILFALPAATSPFIVFLVAWLAVINLTLAIFNMVPAFPMDGGRVLRALLARSRPYGEATATAARWGRGFGIAMVLVGALNFAVLLMLVGMFVYVAAGAEARMVRIREALEGVTAGDLIREEPRTVDASNSVRDLLDRMLVDRRTGYPVVGTDGELVGLASLSALRTVPDGDRSTTTVEAVMAPSPPTIGPDEPAFGVLELLSTGEADRVVVVESGEIVGTVTAADVVSYIELLQGVGPARTPDEKELVPPDGYA